MFLCDAAHVVRQVSSKMARFTFFCVLSSLVSFTVCRPPSPLDFYDWKRELDNSYYDYGGGYEANNAGYSSKNTDAPRVTSTTDNYYDYYDEWVKEGSELMELYPPSEDPERCWDNADKFLELARKIEKNGGNITAKTLKVGRDFYGEYYGTGLIEKALYECVYNGMYVFDDWFHYECYCDEGKPRLRAVACRHGENGTKMNPETCDEDYYNPKDDDWMECEWDEDKKRLKVEKKKVSTEKMVKKSATSRMNSKKVPPPGDDYYDPSMYPEEWMAYYNYRTKRAADITPKNNFPKTSCKTGMNYDDNDFVYYCGKDVRLKATHCICDIEQPTLKSLVQNERVSVNQQTTLKCAECAGKLCQVIENVSSEFLAMSK